MKQNITFLIISAMVLALVGFIFYNNKTDNFGGGGFTERACTVTESIATIGDDISSTILSASGKRAWARIERAEDGSGIATSTPFLSFGGTATLTSPINLATTTPYIDFGKNTDFNYVGAVTGITNGTASTTVKTTECNY